MTRRAVEIELKAQTRAAKRELDKVAKAAADVDDGFADAESAGKRMARSIEQAADGMVDEIDATARAVAELERALGPDFDADTREVVADLKSMGLTAAEIEADADDLAAALKRIDDVKVASARAGFDDLGQSVGAVRDEQNRARDATNSFVGNALSEIPGVSDTFGPLGEAVGQMTEGLLNGEVAIGDLVKAAGPIAGVGAAVVLVTKALQSMAETDAFNERQAEGFRDTIDEIGDSIEAVNQALDDARAIEGRVGGFFGMFETTTDIVPALRELGIEQETVNRAIRDGGAPLDALVARLDAAADAALETAREQQNFGESSRDAFDQANAYTDAVDVLRQAHENYSGAAADARSDTEFFGAEANESADAVNELTEAFADLKGELDDRESFLDVADAFDAVESASNEAWLAAATGSEDADRAARDYERAVIAAKRQVTDYAEAVGDIPPEAVSEILALIDEGALSTAERKLAQLERDRTARLNLQVVAQDPGRYLQRGGVILKDSGGPVGTGRTALVAERRPEFVDGQLVTRPTLVEGPANVTSGAQTARQLSGAAGGNTFVTVLAPAGVDLRWLQRQQFRRTGRTR